MRLTADRLRDVLRVLGERAGLRAGARLEQDVGRVVRVLVDKVGDRVLGVRNEVRKASKLKVPVRAWSKAPNVSAARSCRLMSRIEASSAAARGASRGSGR